MKPLKIAFAGLLAATICVSAAKPTPKSTPVTVTIHRVKQDDDLDKPTFGITKDRADFYVKIWIDGKRWVSKNFSTDDGRPKDWRFTVPVTSNTTKIRIKLCDDDGGLEEQDDFVDINPKDKKKDLDLVYNISRGTISGDLKGSRGKIIHAKGKGDSSQGELWFSVK
ncbi:MAG: hypothetical protein KF784_07505 [Fimbriimonadaceae bacterium]|nr:hypothetical protein [Fimbriimonadaceae bacterium]